MALRLPDADAKITGMRVNLITQSSGPSYPGARTLALSLTIRPSCGLPGDYNYPTDSAALMRLLRRNTDLPTVILQRFEGDMHTAPKAKLLGVNLSDEVLTDIGYFID